MRTFLTAQWTDLINLTYRVSPDLLLDHVPDGLELDIQDGHAFVSFVAFDFVDTRVLGLKIPGHINFPEVNLRFYVIEPETATRGVVFLREYVPKFWIASTARLLYNEPYRKIRMSSSHSKSDSTRTISYTLGESSITVTADNTPTLPAKDSQEYYFKEHEWGFGSNHRGRTMFYRVSHPEWNVFPIISMEQSLDFGALYGPKWQFLENEQPYLSVLADGSEISVFNPIRFDRFQEVNL
ncbi:MAG: YqjF family protein [Candidatus Kariarchaeaceae archaeon]|jgi:uncharacterized protein YqjF (DUF2071 family)